MKHRHLESEEFTKLMETPCHSLTSEQYLQMLEYSVSSSVVLIQDLLRYYPTISKRKMQLDQEDCDLMDKFLSRVHSSLS